MRNSTRRKGGWHSQEPDDLGPGLASAQGDDMTTDAVVEEGTLVLVGLEGRRSLQYAKK